MAILQRNPNTALFSPTPKASGVLATGPVRNVAATLMASPVVRQAVMNVARENASYRIPGSVGGSRSSNIKTRAQTGIQMSPTPAKKLMAGVTLKGPTKGKIAGAMGGSGIGTGGGSGSGGISTSGIKDARQAQAAADAAIEALGKESIGTRDDIFNHGRPIGTRDDIFNLENWKRPSDFDYKVPESDNVEQEYYPSGVDPYGEKRNDTQQGDPSEWQQPDAPLPPSSYGGGSGGDTSGYFDQGSDQEAFYDDYVSPYASDEQAPVDLSSWNPYENEEIGVEGDGTYGKYDADDGLWESPADSDWENEARGATDLDASLYGDELAPAPKKDDSSKLLKVGLALLSIYLLGG